MRALSVCLVAALIFTACSGDDDSSADSDVVTDAPAADTDDQEEPADEPDADETDEPADEPETETEEPEEPAEVLTASFRGVTETSIKVGVAVPDFDALQAAGIGNYQGDADVAFQAFFDAINEGGGIYGRQIEPVYASFDWTQATTQDEACAKFTEDNEVFIVLYGLLGESNLCLTDLHDTMVMTRSFQTTDLRDRSGDTLWLQLNAMDDERTRIMGTVLVDSGRLDGKTVGIIAQSGDNEGLEGQTLQAALAEAGVESTLLLTTAAGDDPLARENEVKLHAERFKVEGVDFVFNLIGGGDTAAIFDRAGFNPPETAYKALGANIDGSTDPSLLDGSVSVSEINQQAIWEDPEFQSGCMDVVRDANPDLVDEMSILPTGDEQAAGVPSWQNPVMIACDHTRLLKAIGELAGADLTNDSFRAALDELGPFDLLGYGLASFTSESKWDGLDEFFIQEYEFATDSIIVSETVVTDR